MSPNFVQTFVSPRPPRTQTASLTPFPSSGGAVTTVWHDDHLVSTYHVDQKGCQGEQKAPCVPPFHIHGHQSENFTVLSGVLCHATGKGERTLLKAGDAEYSHQCAGVAHTMWPMPEGGDVVVKIRTDPVFAGGFTEQFYRNFMSYLDDCNKHNYSPSPFQMFLFLNSADVVLDLPLPYALNKALHHFFGNVIGGWLLGYQSSYAEYYDDKKTA
ncbi:RNA-binding protein [Pseudohyphozyma bogoriensis]|nr:RNA-binding protein [Pseudohyphozyma bogoriensis]